jgi:hypothetical protein
VLTSCGVSLCLFQSFDYAQDFQRLRPFDPSTPLRTLRAIKKIGPSVETERPLTIACHMKKGKNLFEVKLMLLVALLFLSLCYPATVVDDANVQRPLTPS